MALRLDTCWMSGKQLEFTAEDHEDNISLLAVASSESEDLNEDKPVEKKEKRHTVPGARKNPGRRSVQSRVRGAGKKRITSSAQKKQPIAPVMGYYKTVATLFVPGDLPVKRVPQMLIEVKEEDAEEEDAEPRMGKIRVIGEVWCDGTVIHGEGRLKKQGRQLCTMADSKDDITSQAAGGQIWGGFISARLKPTVSGSCFSAHHVDPGLDDCEEEEVRPPVEERMKNGDIICKFTVQSINRNQKKPDVETHLMRLLPLSAITKLNNQGGIPDMMWDPRNDPESQLAKVIECLGVVVDGL